MQPSDGLNAATGYAHIVKLVIGEVSVVLGNEVAGGAAAVLEQGEATLDGCGHGIRIAAEVPAIEGGVGGNQGPLIVRQRPAQRVDVDALAVG